MAHNYIILYGYTLFASVWLFACLPYASKPAVQKDSNVYHLRDLRPEWNEGSDLGHKKSDGEIFPETEAELAEDWDTGKPLGDEVHGKAEAQYYTRELNKAEVKPYARLEDGEVKSKGHKNWLVEAAVRFLFLLKNKKNNSPLNLDAYKNIAISQKPGHRDYLFPFGYGLSYARFIFESMDLSYDDVPKSNLTVTLTIANIGDADGDDVVQCYISWTNKSLPVPQKQLVHYDRVHVLANSELIYAFTLDWMSWAYWDNGTWSVQTGTVIICCGDQPPPIITATDDHIICWPFQVYGSD